MFVARILLAAALLGWQAPTTPSADTVRAFYAAASYEEALAAVDRLAPEAVTADVERVRAMCLLALGRTEQAGASFERLLSLAPAYTLSPIDASPRVLTLFNDVRRRVLPAVVRDRYVRGRASLEKKDYLSAIADLRDVVAIAGEPELRSENPAFADLGDLAGGFLRLAELEVATAQRSAAAPPAPVEAPVVVTPPPVSTGLTVTKIAVYAAIDSDVTPPVELVRTMPTWAPTGALARVGEFRGQLEVVVDDAGRVGEARVVRATVATYDDALLAATRRWRYEPARRAGAPVAYRLAIDYVLSPRR